MADDRKQEAAGAGNSGKYTLQELIAAEHDVMKRTLLICGGIVFGFTEAQGTYSSPEDYFMSLKDKPLVSLMRQSAEHPDDLEWLEDKGKRTPEQQQALVTAAKDSVDAVRALVPTNCAEALILLEDYLTALEDAGKDNIYKQFGETPAEGAEFTGGGYHGDTLNVPLAAVLYFFATNNKGLEPLSPVSPEGFAADERGALIDIFTDMDAFYKEHRAECKTVFDLQRAYITAKNTNPEQAAETLGRLNKLAKIPTEYIQPNHKLVNSLTRATRNMQDHAMATAEIALEVSKHGAKKKVTSTCLLSYEGDNVKISGRQPFTEYDRNVYNAVTSLYVAGNRIVTSDMVWRAMTGKTEQEQPSAGIKSAVTKSLDKMRFMRARIDCSDEFKMRRIQLDGKAVTGAGYDDNLLHMTLTWISTANATVRAYEILSAPVLYQYSAAVKQVQTVPIGLLDVKTLDKHGKPTTHSLEYTERRVIIKGYLLRRIEGMKGKNRLASRCISFMDYRKDGQTHDGLYTIAGSPELSQPMPEGLTDTEKAKRKNDARYIRADAAKILGYWKAIGYIQDYREYKERTAVAGYEIML